MAVFFWELLLVNCHIREGEDKGLDKNKGGNEVKCGLAWMLIIKTKTETKLDTEATC